MQGRHESHEMTSPEPPMHRLTSEPLKTVSAPFATSPSLRLLSPRPTFWSPIKDVWLLHPYKNIFSKNLKIISFNVHRQFVLKSIFQLKLLSNYMSTNSKNKIFLVKYLNLSFYRASHNQVGKILS